MPKFNIPENNNNKTIIQIVTTNSIKREIGLYSKGKRKQISSTIIEAWNYYKENKLKNYNFNK